MKLLLSSFLILLLLDFLSVPVRANNAAFFADKDGTVSIFANDPDTGEESSEIGVQGSCKGIADVCEDAAQGDWRYQHIQEACWELKRAQFLTHNTLDSDKQYTIFLPDNRAMYRLWEDQYGFSRYQNVDVNLVREIFRNHLVKDSRLEPHDLICKERLKVLTPGTKPQIRCNTDVTGATVATIKGKANINTYMPRIIDAGEPIRTCKDIIYVIDDAILYEAPP